MQELVYLEDRNRTISDLLGNSGSKRLKVNLILAKECEIKQIRLEELVLRINRGNFFI